MITFIIGGSSGIGLEMVKQLSNNIIWNFARTESELAHKNYSFNLLDKNASIEFADIVHKEKPDIIVFNSGIGDFSPIGEGTKKTLDIFRVNVVGYIEIIENIMRYLKDNEVGIIVTTSTASYINGAGEATYNATKHALSAYVKSLQTELKDVGSKTFITEFVMHATNATNMTKQTPSIEETEYLKSVISKLLKAFKNKKAIFIPKYEDLYKGVFDKYYDNPINQGLESLKHKRLKATK